MRTLLSLAFLATVLWASCTVKLGAYTLAEHVDRIGETDQAKDLLDGTRGRISPLLEDMKQRVFGEYVEAPTRPTPTKEPASERRRPASRPAQAALRTEAPARGSTGKPEAPSRGSTGAPEAPARTGKPEAPAGRSTGAPEARPSRRPSSADEARLPGSARARRGDV